MKITKLYAALLSLGFFVLLGGLCLSSSMFASSSTDQQLTGYTPTVLSSLTYSVPRVGLYRIKVSPESKTDIDPSLAIYASYASSNAAPDKERYAFVPSTGQRLLVLDSQSIYSPDGLQVEILSENAILYVTSTQTLPQLQINAT